MINEQIRDKEIRLIGENGEQLGIMSARDAMKMAKEAELDLVKIAPAYSSIKIFLKWCNTSINPKHCWIIHWY